MRVPRVSSRAFRRLTLVDIVLLVAVVVSGAVVRLTNSGLGCADWPRCSPSEFISVATHHSTIEQLNRLFSGAIGIPIALTLVAAYQRSPRRRDLIALGWVMCGLFLSNAVVGGISVKVELAWVSVMGHFLLALALIAVALVMHKRAGEPDGPRHLIVPPQTMWFARAIYALTIWVLVAGTLVTAAGPHGGDIEAKRLSWPIADVARVHAGSVDLLVALVLVLVVMLVLRLQAGPIRLPFLDRRRDWLFNQNYRHLLISPGLSA
jgi:cytochrome c oxidase assembly protein subunit 15